MPGFESKGNRCVDVNECKDPLNCINGFCLNLPGKYSCMCMVCCLVCSMCAVIIICDARVCCIGQLKVDR